MTPLAGKRVVDFSRYAPGPYASLLCSALGAEVIKIESPPDGDPLRGLDPRAFEKLNAGKKSIVVDLKSKRDAAIVRELVASADILIESFRPGVMARLDLSYERCAATAPELIYVSISGYGQSGPYAQRAGHDLGYMAVAGALGASDSPLPIQFADFAAGGLFAVIGILAAVHEGRGRHIDLSMHDGLLSLALLADGAVGDVLSGRLPCYRLYRTRDDRKLSVGALEPKFWSAFCECIGRPSLESRASDPAASEEVAAVIATRTAADWETRFESVDACVEVVRTHDEAVAHPQATHRAAMGTRPRLPFGSPASELGPAPALDEHGDEIRRTLG